MKKLSILFLLIMCGSAQAVFDYDRAVCCGKKGDWERASTLLGQVPTDRPDVAYDKGVVAHHKKEFSVAKECFLHAACHPEADPALVERAHFNVGNVCVALKDLEGAREHYKKVLTLNPENTFAAHNLKKIEEMLNKQQEEQKKEDKKEKEEEKQQDKKEQKDNKNKSKQDKQQQNPEKEKQDKKDSPGQQGGDKQEQSSDDGGEQQKQKPESQGEQEQESGKQQESEDEPSEGKPQQQKEQRDEKEKKQGGAGEKNKQQMQLAQGQPKKDPASHDEWLAGLLEKSDKRDAQGNKKMIKAMVQQQMGGNEGQNCW